MIAGASMSRPRGIPVTLSSFVGRSEDLANVLRLLDRHRLITLVGPGGVGKTRLAVRAAELLTASDKRAGETEQLTVIFADFAPLTDASLLPADVLRSVGGQDETPEAVDALIQYLRTKSLLLILDNCEHLLDGCAQLATTLLAACRDLRILVTSREPLGLDGEHLWRVRPLLVSPPAIASTGGGQAPTPAVQLFADRAQAVDPSFELNPTNASAIAEICWRLDGLPLAIELAARYVHVLSVQDIARRLAERAEFLRDNGRSRPARHQTLRSVLEWSAALLTEEERRVFRRVSIFAGNWTLESAEAICGDELLTGADVLGLLGRLIDKSLIVSTATADGMQYRLLETVRQFGRTCLQESGEEDEIAQRHSEYFDRLSECAAQTWRTPRQNHWLRRISSAYDNLRLALEWHVAHNADSGLRLCANLVWFWERTGRIHEARQWLLSLLSAASSDTPLRAAAVIHCGNLALLEGDMPVAQRLLEDGLRLARAQADARTIALALSQLARVMNRRGDIDVARELCAHGLSVSRAAGDVQREIDAQLNTGIIAAEQGDHAAAERAYSRTITLSQEVGDEWSRALALRSLGHVLRVQGQASPARRLFDEALAIWKEMDDPWGIAWSQSGLGYLAIEAGDYVTAEALLRECLQLRAAIGSRGSIANSLEAFASLAAAMGQPRRAYRLVGAVLQLRDSMGEHPPDLERAAFERSLERARRDLSPEECDAALLEGAAMTLNDAEAYALLPQTNPGAPCQDTDPALRALEDLTPRERDVLNLLRRGYSNKQIADALVISVRTVETHVERVLRKFDLRTRGEVVAWAAEHSAGTN